MALRCLLWTGTGVLWTARMKTEELLLRAAVLGFLGAGFVGAATTACGGVGAEGALPSGGARSEMGPSSGGAAGLGSGGADGGPASGGADGGPGSGGSAATEGVTSTRDWPGLTLEEFTKMCDDAEGTVELHSHCGGVVSGRGFSYDSTIGVFTEHTCRGYNTCTGFSCLLDEPA